MQKDIRGLAELIDQMANLQMQLVTVGERMKGAVDALNSQGLFEDDMPKNTQDL